MASAALMEAQYAVDSGNSDAGMRRVKELALIFFRCSAMAMLTNAMKSSSPSAQGGRYVSLDAVGQLNNANSDQEQDLAAIVDAAD